MNIIEEAVEKFVNQYKYYKNDIYNLFDYLSEKRNVDINNTNILLSMQGMETEEVKNSLEYLIETGRYKSEETAKKYINAISSFFGYLREENILKKCNLYVELEKNTRREESYVARMTYYIETCSQLKEKKPINCIDSVRAKELLTWCDKQLSSVAFWIEDTGYKKACAALCIKMMLIYGITYRRARSLRLKQIHMENNEIELGEHLVRFPAHLGKQLEQFLAYRKKNCSISEDDYLFTSKAGKAWNGNTSSSGIPDYLNRQFGSRDLTGIIKYGIGQLLLAGLSDHLVKEITGASDDLIKGSVSKEDSYRELNNKIVTVELFYDF